MSRFFSPTHSSLVPYVPGEQLNDKKYIKLNTNESPFPPSPKVKAAVEKSVEALRLYPDPDCKKLREKISETFNIPSKNIVVTNGSDEVLNFAFLAFCDEKHPALFPNHTYGFYKVFCALYNIPYTECPLREDFTIDVNDYIGAGRNIFIANPNAPTGIALGIEDIEKIVASNPNNVVVVDEAYVDFGGESALSLIGKYDNLLVTRTFSKSYSMAGVRLGMGFGSEELIADINTLRYSTNPYNINSLTLNAGVAALEENTYYIDNCRVIEENRAYTIDALRSLGFEVLDSKANFVFARSGRVSGIDLYTYLRERGILVRHFEKDGICEFNRITIGSLNQMKALVQAVKEILEERQ